MAGERVQRPLARLLLDSMSEPRRGQIDWEAYSGVRVAELLDAIDMHKIGPAVYVHLKGAGAPAEIMAQLHRRYQAQIIRQMQLRADLGAISRLLGELPWVAIKGPVLAEHAWSRPDLRQYADLDLVVDRLRFPEVLDMLLGAGAAMVDENWALIRDQVRGEISLTLPRGTALDLHWDVVNDRRLRKYFDFPVADMLRRRRVVSVGKLRVPTFDACDTLLHVAYHTAHSGGHRLLWLKDLERVTADPALDWATVAQRARAYGVEGMLAILLQRTADVLGFEVAPPDAALAPARRAWGRLARLAERRFPAPLLPGDRYSGQLIFKSIRPSIGASLAAAFHTARTRAARSPEQGENPLHVATADTSARDSYLAIVSAPQRP